MMQDPGDNSITVVEPHLEAYADSNLNEKNLGTQYIYTTEGQLIPANDQTSTMDLSSQPYSTTTHVTEAQNIHIQQVDYQYDPHFVDGNVATHAEYVSSSNNFIMEPATYVPETTQGKTITEQTYSSETTTYSYSSSTSIIETDASYVSNLSPAPQAVEKPESSLVKTETKVTEEEKCKTGDESVSKDVEMKEKEAEVVPAAEQSVSVLEQENLESNPAIEIEHIDSTEQGEQVSNMSQEVSVEDTGTEDSEALEGEEIYDFAAETEVAAPRPRGRKPKSEIPLHILGHDVNKPVESFVNGKTPKPRLGVKVPYRNLTSQIVSKADIEKEVVERGQKKLDDKKDKIFARQLTSRLAEKIGPSSDSTKKRAPRSSRKADSSSNKEDTSEVDSNGNEDSPKKLSAVAIDNNSDLLAILEGDGEDVCEEMLPADRELEIENSTTPTDETNLKNLEREIALQQLQDLPYMSPKTKYVKGNRAKVYSKEPVSSSSEGKVSSSSDMLVPSTRPQGPKSPIKANASKFDEPQVKVNIKNLKTYSRKRKSSENIVDSSPSPSKKSLVSPSKANSSRNVEAYAYITKSSRIIKKKVIWDPDEASPKSKSPAIKTEPKPTQSKNEHKSADLSKKSAADAKIKTEKKVHDKPSPKKVNQNADKKASPGASKVALKHKKLKPLSEVDKLLGDEGAIKMLYELKKADSPGEEKRRKTVMDVDKTFKDLAKKANQIKSDLVNNTSTRETPKSLRKKETGVSPGSPTKPALTFPSGISRQKSKDSTRSSPPPSPGYSFTNEVSYLVRRRSSSSISSGADDTGGSFDFDDTEDDSEDSDYIDRLSKTTPVSTTVDPLKIKRPKRKAGSDKPQKRSENRFGHYKTFTLKKANKNITIDLHTKANATYYFTLELLRELTAALNKVSKEKDCNVVLIRSSKDTVFSHGLDYSVLVADKEAMRQSNAKELANEVKDFIRALIDFPKILVAGIQGQCTGLAVTMLPLFDIVIASDDATFSAPYSSLGCTAEAGFLLAVPYVASYGLAGELLYASQTLTADEACRRGLVSRLCWPEKYQETLKVTVAAVAQGSKQSLETTKRRVRAGLSQTCEEALESMVSDLVEHWTSNECQNNFSRIG